MPFAAAHDFWEIRMSVVETLVASLQARAAVLRGLGYRVQFVLSDTGESILLDATGGAVDIAEGGGPADTVLELSSGDLTRLIAGKLSPMLAFSLGKLKVEGSKGVAMKLASLLDED
jgi:putative sterol carrier protein